MGCHYPVPGLRRYRGSGHSEPDGQKMRYASMLYGDSAASVLESSDGEEDVKDEIIRAALSGQLTEETEQVKHLFSTGNEKVVQVSTEISGRC
jgi:hypothetical protein